MHEGLYSSMPEEAKIAVLSWLNKTGFFGFVRSVTKSQFRILTYHRFGESYTTSQSFKNQIEYIKNHFNVIDLQSYLNFLSGKNRLPSNSVLLTVDDGYKDFYTVAFPILKRYGVPATVFLTVDFIDKKMWLWHDLLNFALDNTPRSDITFNGRNFDLADRQERFELKLSFDNICTSYGSSERDLFITQVLKDLKVTVPNSPSAEYAPLTWTQILEMSDCGILYGAHTCTHPILSKIHPHEALREIRQSKHRIEEVVQKDISAFCYPNGKEDDFNKEVKDMVRECGFMCAFSTIYGMNDLQSDRYALKRMAAGGKSFAHFVHDVSGFGVLRRSLRGGKNKFT